MSTTILVASPNGAPRWAIQVASELADRGADVIWWVLPARARLSLADLADRWVRPAPSSVFTGESGTPARFVTASDLDGQTVIWAHPDEPPGSCTAIRVRLDGAPWPSPSLAFGATARNAGRVHLQVTRASSGEERVLASAVVRADPQSPVRTRAACEDKVPALLRTSQTAQPGPAMAAGAPPSATALLAGGARVVSRWLSDKWALRGRIDQWQVGFRFGGDPLDPTGFVWMQPPTDRFWADPVPFERDGEHYVFYEELPYATHIGHLCVARVHRDGSYDLLGTVLKMDTHLSFPQVFAHNGTVWMVPETLALGEVALYRCVEFPLRWERHCQLIPGPFVDTTVFPHKEGWALLTSRTAGPAESGYDNLHAAFAPELTGPWSDVGDPVRIDIRGARMAGAPAQINGRLIRAAQDCAVRYGHGVRFTAIAHLAKGHLSEQIIRHWPPEPGERARHSWGVAGELVVTDRQVRRDG